MTNQIWKFYFYNVNLDVWTLTSSMMMIVEFLSDAGEIQVFAFEWLS